MKKTISKLKEIFEKATDQTKEKIITSYTILALTGALGQVTFPTTKDGKKETGLERVDKRRSFDFIK